MKNDNSSAFDEHAIHAQKQTKEESITQDQQNRKSIHILSASSNLLGICFVVMTSIKILGQGSKTIIDTISAIAIMLFMASFVFSFLSLRESSKSRELENVADIIFCLGLALLSITTILFSFNIID